MKNFENELQVSYLYMAGIELAMNYYSLFERWTAEEGSDKIDLDKLCGGKKCLEQLNQLVIRAILNDDVSVNTLSEALAQREYVTANMKNLLTIVDEFRLFEYALDRKIASFSTVDSGDDEENARKILGGIFASDDNLLINENIRKTVSLLPVRMTKNRFYDIISESLKMYTEGPKDSFEKIVYMVESSSGLIKVVETEDFEQLLKYRDEFANIKYGELDEKQALEVKNRLDEVIVLLTDSVELYQSLAELVNLVCVILINDDGSLNDIKEELDNYDIILEKAIDGIKVGIHGEMEPEIVSAFERIEGRLEYYAEHIGHLETKLFSAYERGDASVKSSLKSLMDSQKLMSSSLFVELEDVTEEKLPEDYLNSEIDRIIKGYAASFECSERLLIRARMAAAIREFPVFFSSRTEVMNYILDSLSGCRDVGEKKMAIDMILEELES